MPSVVEMFECPMRLDTISGFTPIEMHIEAYVCRYGIITTNGKSLYFQGVHAFAVIYSIPFPS